MDCSLGFITFRKDSPRRRPFAFSKTKTREHLHDPADKTINGPPVRNTSPEENIDFDSEQKN